MTPIKAPVPQTFQKTGKWVEKPRISVILMCLCGNKYIKTRKDQDNCVKCLVKSKGLR